MSKGIGYTELLGEQEFLCKEMVWDVAIETTIAKIELRNDVVDPKSGRKKQAYVAYYAALKCPHVLNKTNKKFLIRAFGGTSTAAWVGRDVTVYVDKRRKRRNPDGSMGMIALMVGDQFSGESGPTDSTRRVRRKGNGPNTARSMREPGQEG